METTRVTSVSGFRWTRYYCRGVCAGSGRCPWRIEAGRASRRRAGARARGIAMAQLGDLVRAKALRVVLRVRSVRKRRWCARCALPRPRSRLFRATWAGLRRARCGAGDARTARRPGERRACADSRGPAPPPIRRLDEAERTLADLDPAPFPPASRAAHELVVAGIAIGSRGRRQRARRSSGPSAPRSRPVSRR